jgi:hypothetical protein
MRCGSAPDPGAGVGRQAHWLDERHQDLIDDLGEQLIGRR